MRGGVYKVKNFRTTHNLFSSIRFGLEHRGKDIFGRIYEYFLGKFTEAEGKKSKKQKGW